MKKTILCITMLLAFPVFSVAEEKSNEELYRMILNMERKLDAALDEAGKAKAEAEEAKAEAARAKAELAELRAAPSVGGNGGAVTGVVRATESKAGLSASFEALHMRPSRTGLDFVIVDGDTDQYPEGGFGSVEPDFNGGWRLGLDYDFGSGTFIGTRYMSFDSEDSDSFTRPEGGALWGTWLHPNSIIDDNDVTDASASYDFSQETFDVVAGKRFDLGGNAGLDFAAGLRYANVTQEFDIEYHQVVTEELARHDYVTETNEFSGWGPVAGLDASWEAGSGFSFFGAVTGALLVGDFDLSYHDAWQEVGGSLSERIDLDGTVSNRVVPVVETRLGIGYAGELSNGMLLGARTGYEWQNWFNMVVSERFADDVDPQLMSTTTTDIGLDGYFFQGFLRF